MQQSQQIDTLQDYLMVLVRAYYDIGKSSSIMHIDLRKPLQVDPERSFLAGPPARNLLINKSRHCSSSSKPVSAFLQASQEDTEASVDSTGRLGETIVALSSGSGRSAVAVIRISGPQAGMSHFHSADCLC